MCLTVFVASCSSFTSKKNNGKELGSQEQSYYQIIVDGKRGFVDARGRIVIEPQYDYTYGKISEGLCYVEIGERRGMIDASGNFVMEFPDTIDYVTDFIHDHAIIGSTHCKGVIRNDGKYIVPLAQDGVMLNIDGDSLYFIVVCDGSKEQWCVKDKLGRMIGTPCDSILIGYRNGLCPIKVSDKWGYMDTAGDVVIEPQYDYARTFNESGVARVRKGSSYYFIDKEGNELWEFDCIFTGIINDRAVVLKNGKKYLVNGVGEIICEVYADRVSSFREDGYAVAFNGNKASLIDTMGRVVLATEYENIGTFIEGIALVKKDKAYGFIDISGKEIIPVKYDDYEHSLNSIDSPVRGVFVYENWTLYATYYDLNGNVVWQDIPEKKQRIPYKPKRKDFVEYFDSRLAELDPIEGVYYVTQTNYYQDRDNLNSIGLNGTSSEFYAIAKDERDNSFTAYCVDGSNMVWVNKFVKLGDTNNYAIMKLDEETEYSSEGRVVVEDPSEFNFRLERGHNSGYNFFVTYDFVRDYPPVSEYEKVVNAEWSGSGFAIADGYLVTNYHVTSGAKTILVRGVNGDMNEWMKAFVVASDKEHDLSILKIVDKDFDGMEKIPYTLGKTQVDVGDDIFVLGYPMTETMGEEIKLTEGIISSGTGYKGDPSMYQISAAVQPGNSGGPVFNSDGNVVGVVCGKHSDAENANYAIKISYLYSLVNSADIGVVLEGQSKVKDKKLSAKVKNFKGFVYLIECSSK